MLAVVSASAVAARQSAGRKVLFHLGCIAVAVVEAVAMRNMAESGVLTEYIRGGSATEPTVEGDVLGSASAGVAGTRDRSEGKPLSNGKGGGPTV